jgi:hypothetical protein
MLFQKILFFAGNPKFYKCIFFWNVKSTSNYSEKLKLTGIHRVTL